MWSLKSLNKPVKSAPTIVASAVLVGALSVLLSPVHSAQEAVARAATRAAKAVEREAATQATRVDQRGSERLPPARPPLADRTGLHTVIRSIEDSLEGPAVEAAQPAAPVVDG